MSSFTRPLPVPQVPQGGGIIGGMQNWQKIAADNIANQTSRLQAGILQQNLNNMPLDQELKTRINLLDIAHKGLENQYYGASQQADINFKNAQASLAPSERQKNFAQANLFGQQAAQAKANMNYLKVQRDAMIAYASTLSGQPSVTDAAAQAATGPAGGAQQPSQQPAQGAVGAPDQDAGMPAQPQSQPEQDVSRPTERPTERMGRPQQAIGVGAPAEQQQPQQVSPSVQQLPPSESFREPQVLAHNRATRFLASITPKDAIPVAVQNEMDEQKTDYNDFRKESSAAAAAANTSVDILQLINEARNAYNDATAKGNPISAEYAHLFKTRLDNLTNQIVLKKFPELKGSGKVSNLLVTLLQSAKASTAMKGPAFAGALNDMQKAAIDSIEYNKFLNQSNDNYKKAGYGDAIPSEYAQSLYDNYRNNVHVQNDQGHLYYQRPDQNNKIQDYTGLKALYGTLNNGSYNAPEQDIPEQIIYKNMVSHPNRTRGQIIAALRHGASRRSTNVR